MHQHASSEAAHRQLQRSQALAAVTRAIAAVATPEEWGARAVAAVEGATGWSRVFLFRLSEAGPFLDLVAARGVTPEQRQHSARLRLDGSSLSAQAVLRRQPIVVGRPGVPVEAVATTVALGTPSFAVLPLVARSQVLGTLTLLDAEARPVSEDDLEFLLAVADALATGLENAQLYAASESALAEMRRLERAKNGFLSVASHELRTPLTPLKGLTQSLLRQMDRAKEGGQTLDPERLERYLRTMDGQLDRLSALVNDLLDVSRIQTGRLQLRLEDVDLVALTAAVLERFDAVALVHDERTSQPLPELATGAEDDRHHRVIFRPRVAQVTGRWDAGRLDQVVTNLVSNSLKYTPAGGDVTVEVDAEERSTGWHGRLTVRDPGIGIPPEQIADLFHPFVRLENAPPEHFGGLGLGLYITHDIVMRHGGQVWVESLGEGQGANFYVALPMAGPPAETPPAGAGAAG